MSERDCSSCYTRTEGQAHGESAVDMISVPLPKGCMLLLTEAEYQRGLLRGKVARRRKALAERFGQAHKQHGG